MDLHLCRWDFLINYNLWKFSRLKPIVLHRFSNSYILFFISFRHHMCWQHCSRAYTVENENITLSVRYSSAYSLLWYRQLHHTSVPQFLMFILQSSGKVVQSSNKRLSGKLNAESKRVDLIIPSSTVQDSAVYYCPL